MTDKEIYEQGLIDGITAFAWWKDGDQWVGTGATRLRDTLSDLSSLWNYNRTMSDKDSTG